MLKEPTKFQMNGLGVEVNWNKDVSPCKKFKFSLGDQTAIIDKKDLYGLLFMFGDEADKEEMIPVTTTQLIMVKKLLTIRAKKNIKVGELIKTTYEYPIDEKIYSKIILSDSTIRKSEKTLEKHILNKK